MRATEKYYEDFVRGGANLSKENQEKLRALNEELSKLSLQFGENLLAETNRNFKLVIDDKTGLEGLPEDVIARAADDAKAFGEEGKWVFTLAKPSMLPFLQYAKNRDCAKSSIGVTLCGAIMTMPSTIKRSLKK